MGFVGNGRRFTGDLVAFSKSGIVMRCSEDLPPGTVGRLGISAGHEIVRVLVTVRRRIPRVGLHFKFVKMTSRDRQLLRSLLRGVANSHSG